MHPCAHITEQAFLLTVRPRISPPAHDKLLRLATHSSWWLLGCVRSLVNEINSNQNVILNAPAL